MLLAANFARDLTIAGGRWIHLLAGITWIGLLYYFNFVQTPAFAAFDPAARTEAIRKLVPRALWWFRWAALLTFLTGVIILGAQQSAGHKTQLNGDYFASLPGMAIFAGALIATVMMTNVWMVIWPNQRIVIANAERVASGQEPDPAAAPAARAGLLASRTNTLFSISVMFFMIGTTHFVTGAHFKPPTTATRWTWYIVVIGLTAIIEANALGLIGGTGPGPTKKPLEDHRDTIVAGFILWAVFFILLLALFYQS